MEKRLLIISPTPTHNPTAGNRARILATSELFKRNGYKTDFIFAPQDTYDYSELKAYWGENLYLIENKPTATPSLYSRIQNKLKQYSRRIIKSDSLKYNRLIDDYYPAGLDRFLTAHLSNNEYDIVLVEYAVYSKALLHFSRKSAIKIIDTHDKFGDRYKTYLSNGLTPNWYSLFPPEEIKGLNRADIVLAIQDEEARYFKEKCRSNVITLGHVVEFDACRSYNAEKRIVFVASDNILNITSLNHFLENCFNRIVARDPSIKLIIAGNICRSTAFQISRDIKDNVIVYGKFLKTSEVYSLGKIAINPVSTGTGLKIKLIEAVSHALPVVSYGSNNEFPDVNSQGAIFYAGNDEEFCTQIFASLSLSEQDAIESCRRFIKEYNHKSTSNLFQTIAEQRKNVNSSKADY